MKDSSQPSTPPLLSIALLAAAALAYEVLLIRLYAIIQWHHFAYMIISLALLGYGASGTFLALLGESARRRFRIVFSTNAILFAMSAVGGFLLAQKIPFNPLEIAWERWQLVYLLAQYLLLAVPFFFVANCFGLAFLAYREKTHLIYAFDLGGAGLGALGIIVLLFLLRPALVLPLTALLALLAVVLTLAKSWRWLGSALVIVMATVLLQQPWWRLELSEYKGLSQALKVVGATPLTETSSPLGSISVVANRRIPFRYAPGLSLATPASPGEQLALFSDGEPIGAITRFDGDLKPLIYLDYLTSALPYHLLHQPRVLVLGAGGGGEVLQALYQQAASVDAVELNPRLVDLLQHEFDSYAGGLYRHPDVKIQLREARAFVAASRERYDLIQIALLDSFATAAAGLYALNESTLYTVQAFQEYLSHLNPAGLLSITRWLRLPPRDSLKLFATAVVALENKGVVDPGAHLAMIRGWKTVTLVVKNSPLSERDIAVLDDFCQRRSFDLVYYPGMPAARANRFNLLQQPYLFEAAQALLGPQRDVFFTRYKFNIQPATDDQPYFFHFFKWKTLPELLALRAGVGFGQLEWGYLVLVATFGQAVLAGVVLILLPLWLNRRRRSAATARWRVLLYFIAIGLGFLFLEIAFIQKFVLFLGHPLYAIAVVLSAFLICAGLGSRYGERIGRRPQGLFWVATVIVGVSLCYLWLLPQLINGANAWPDSAKIVCTVLLIAPLAFFMGMPFPLGLKRIASDQVPWAWAINGCASVVSAVAAVLLAMQIGFSGVVSVAAGFYLLAALVAPRGSADPGGSA